MSTTDYRSVEKKLKPCPFCGSHGQLRILPQTYGFSVDCTFCSATMRVITKFIDQALAAWNRRDGKIDLTICD